MRACLDCGEPLPEGCSKNKQRCDVCARKRHTEQCREHDARIREERRSHHAKKASGTTRNMSLVEAAKAAREAGLSYGQYVARMGGNR